MNNYTTVVWRLPEIPPANGASPSNLDPAYQDHNPSDSSTNPDRYIIFHFRTDHISTYRGVQYPGISSVVAFHGQGYGGQRVDGNNMQRNERVEIMGCQTDVETTFDVFYPGSYTNEQVADINFPERARILTWFGNYLIRLDLLTTSTFTRHGQLGLTPPDHCGLQYFQWGGYYRSRQFGPNGGPPAGDTGGDTQPPVDDNQQDDDGV